MRYHKNTMKNEKRKVSKQTTGLAGRLIPPTIAIALLTLLAVAIFSNRITEEIYTYQLTNTLSNNTKTIRNILQDGWKRTTGSTLRTTEVMTQYVEDVLGSQINLLQFPSKSGIIIADSYSKQILQVYPKGVSAPTIKEIRPLLRTTQGEKTIKLKQGGLILGQHFAPLQLHIISFSQESFENLPERSALTTALFTAALLTTFVITLLMFLLLKVSVVRPIQHMRNRMGHIIKTDQFSKNIPAEGALEMQELTGQFNTLLHHIAKRDKQLNNYTENLEGLVLERTKALEEAQEKNVLQERLAAIGEFSSSIAHELRNPLSSIKLGVEKLSATEALGANDKRRLELMRKEVTRLDVMLKGILSFSSRTPTELSQHSMQNILADIQPFVEALSAEYQLDIQLPNSKTKHTIMADENKLVQALINILKNACQAAQGHSDVKLSYKKNGANLILTVQNGGDVISKEVLARLFEPFFTTKSSGTGLGLPTTKRLLQEMGGDITLTSTKKNGTVTEISLPLASRKK